MKYKYSIYPEILTEDNKLVVTHLEGLNAIRIGKNQEFQMGRVEINTDIYSDDERTITFPVTPNRQYHVRFSVNGRKINNLDLKDKRGSFYFVDCSNVDYGLAFDYDETDFDKFDDDLLVVKVATDINGKIKKDGNVVTGITTVAHKSQIIIDTLVLDRLRSERIFVGKIPFGSNIMTVSSVGETRFGINGSKSSVDFFNNQVLNWEISNQGDNLEITSWSNNPLSTLALNPKKKVHIFKELEVDKKAEFHNDVIVDNTIRANKVIAQTTDIEGDQQIKGDCEAQKAFLVKGATTLESTLNVLNDKTTLHSLGVNNNIDVGGNVTIIGKLEVKGERTEIKTKDLVIEDNIITLNKGYTGELTSIICGVEMARGEGLPSGYLLYFEEDKTMRAGIGTAANFASFPRLATRGPNLTKKYIPFGENIDGGTFYTESVELQYDEALDTLSVPNINLSGSFISAVNASLDGFSYLSLNDGPRITNGSKESTKYLRIISPDGSKGGIQLVDSGNSLQTYFYFDKDAKLFTISSESSDIEIQPFNIVTVTKKLAVNGTLKVSQGLTVEADIVSTKDVNCANIGAIGLVLTGKAIANDIELTEKMVVGTTNIGIDKITADTGSFLKHLNVGSPSVVGTALDVQGDLAVTKKVNAAEVDALDAVFQNIKVQLGGISITSSSEGNEPSKGKLEAEWVESTANITAGANLVATNDVVVGRVLNVENATANIQTLNVTKVLNVQSSVESFVVSCGCQFLEEVSFVKSFSVPTLTVQTKLNASAATFGGQIIAKNNFTIEDTGSMQIDSNTVNFKVLDASEKITSKDLTVDNEFVSKDVVISRKLMVEATTNPVIFANSKSIFDNTIQVKSLVVSGVGSSALVTDMTISGAFRVDGESSVVKGLSSDSLSVVGLVSAASLKIGTLLNVNATDGIKIRNNLSFNPDVVGKADIEFADSGHIDAGNNVIFQLDKKTQLGNVNFIIRLDKGNDPAVDIFKVLSDGKIWTSAYTNLDDYFLANKASQKINGSLEVVYSEDSPNKANIVLKAIDNTKPACLLLENKANGESNINEGFVCISAEDGNYLTVRSAKGDGITFADIFRIGNDKKVYFFSGVDEIEVMARKEIVSMIQTAQLGDKVIDDAQTEDITTLSTKVSAIEADIVKMKDPAETDSIAYKIAAIDTQISEMKDAENVGSLANKIAEINTTTGVLTGKVSSLETRITDVETLATTINTMNNEDTEGSLANRVKELEAKVVTLQSEVDALTPEPVPEDAVIQLAGSYPVHIHTVTVPGAQQADIKTTPATIESSSAGDTPHTHQVQVSWDTDKFVGAVQDDHIIKHGEVLSPTLSNQIVTDDHEHTVIITDVQQAAIRGGSTERVVSETTNEHTHEVDVGWNGTSYTYDIVVPPVPADIVMNLETQASSPGDHVHTITVPGAQQEGIKTTPITYTSTDTGGHTHEVEVTWNDPNFEGTVKGNPSAGDAHVHNVVVQ